MEWKGRASPPVPRVLSKARDPAQSFILHHCQIIKKNLNNILLEKSILAYKKEVIRREKKWKKKGVNRPKK